MLQHFNNLVLSTMCETKDNGKAKAAIQNFFQYCLNYVKRCCSIIRLDSCRSLYVARSSPAPSKALTICNHHVSPSRPSLPSFSPSSFFTNSPSSFFAKLCIDKKRGHRSLGPLPWRSRGNASPLAEVENSHAGTNGLGISHVIDTPVKRLSYIQQQWLMFSSNSIGHDENIYAWTATTTPKGTNSRNSDDPVIYGKQPLKSNQKMERQSTNLSSSSSSIKTKESWYECNYPSVSFDSSLSTFPVLVSQNFPLAAFEIDNAGSKSASNNHEDILFGNPILSWHRLQFTKQQPIDVKNQGSLLTKMFLESNSPVSPSSPPPPNFSSSTTSLDYNTLSSSLERHVMWENCIHCNQNTKIMMVKTVKEDISIGNPNDHILFW
ncbi:hypothetical protein BC941DRAFT_475855 [Chlamydoabsidia padenii]|nr:hypothetical protein BC941DRAFT_475855 [Chlamydoabsidia padenii]